MKTSINKEFMQISLKVAEESEKYCVYPINTHSDQFEFFTEVYGEYLVSHCANLIQDMVDQRIPASEYPYKLIEHFKAGYNIEERNDYE